MMFVSGTMGPYMSPIPANASIAMLFSFFVAVTVTPWLLLRFARGKFREARTREMRNVRPPVGGGAGVKAHFFPICRFRTWANDGKTMGETFPRVGKLWSVFSLFNGLWRNRRENLSGAGPLDSAPLGRRVFGAPRR